MPEKGLDGADIRPVFEEMCGKGMTKAMDGHPLRDARPLFCMPHDGPDGTRRDGSAGNHPREEPRYGPIRSQIGDEQFEGRRRENAVTI